MILKSGVNSPERLLKRHRAVPASGRRAAARAVEGDDGGSRKAEAAVAGQKVLVVDDDVRNIFAMTSVLEANGVKVIYADNGRAGIEALESDPDIDLVLMDIMMPGMDGYQTMQAIRRDPALPRRPDRRGHGQGAARTTATSAWAGASDYLPKPVDTDQAAGRDPPVDGRRHDREREAGAVAMVERSGSFDPARLDRSRSRRGRRRRAS